MEAKQTLIRLSLLLLICASTNSLQALVKKGKLFKGKSMTSEINPTEKHQYVIYLNKNQFAFFRITQIAVDLKITTYDSEGKK